MNEKEAIQAVGGRSSRSSTDLQELIGAQLKGLPLPRAPATLVSGVLAATARHGSEGSVARWRSRMAVAAVLALSVVGGWQAWPMLEPWGAGLLTGTGSPSESSSGLARGAEDAATVMRVLWEVLLQPAATYIFALGLTMTFACALIWTALDRFAVRGPTHR